MAVDDELNRIAEQLQLQQANGDSIRQQLQVMQSNALEIGSAIEAIQNLRKASKDVLVPIGAGAYISCPKPDPEKVVIGIGANVLVNKKPEEAVKLLEARQKTINDAANAAQRDLEQVINQIDGLTQRASMLAAGANQNVRSSKE